MLSRLGALLKAAWGRKRMEADMADELRFHVEARAEDLVRDGFPRQEAVRRAHLEFGGLESTKEECHQALGLRLLDECRQDVRYALRSLRRNPGFTTVAVFTLALGIGGTTAIFSVVNAVLLRPLAFKEPGRLVTVTLRNPGLERIGLMVGLTDLGVSGPVFEAIRGQARSLQGSALFAAITCNLTGEGEPERISAARVSADLFRLLGVKPQLGRTFAPEEDQMGREAVVLISHSLWTRRSGQDARVLSRKVLLNGSPHTIIGVMPAGFNFPSGPEFPYAALSPTAPVEIWRPLALVEWERTDATSLNFAMVARLRPGYSQAQARSELSTKAAQAMGTGYGRTGWIVNLRPLQSVVTGNVRAPLLILFAAVAVVLLIACANAASLLVARGFRRRAEIGMRLSLGAARGRVVRQLLSESMVLAGCALPLGILLAAAGIRGLVRIAPIHVPRIESASVDAQVLGFACLATILTVVLFGTAPAFVATQLASARVIQGSGQVTTPGASQLRSVLVAGQFALSVVLLVASGLLIKSFVTVARTWLGFHAENIMTMRLTLPSATYNQRRRATFVEELVANSSTLPGVSIAAAVSALPLTGEGEGWGVVPEDNPHIKIPAVLRVRAITPAYFRAFGIRPVAGREFRVNDGIQTPVAIISESAARRLWPGMPNPIGRRFRMGDHPWMTIVGIVEDTRASGIDRDVLPYMYLPFRQFAPEEFAVAVRSRLNPAGLAGAVKSEIWRIDKDLPVVHVATMRQIVADSMAARRFPAVLMGIFVGFALLLAAVGVYGVVSCSVVQRAHEIGIRIALGATRLDVLTGVLKGTGALVLGGSILGLAAALALAPLLRSLLYGVGPFDPSVLAASAVVLIVVAAAACYVPARRATRIDPVEALRCE